MELHGFLETLYKGYGKNIDPRWSKYGVDIPETLNRRWLVNPLLDGETNERNVLVIAKRRCSFIKRKKDRENA